MILKDKVALITGGGRGIGKAIAMHYGREGAKLALCARSTAELDQTIKELRAINVDAEGWNCDVSLEGPVKDFVANAHKKFGRIDVLVNNAGVMTRPTPMTELDVKKWDYTIAVNLRGPFLITQSVLPIMIKQKAGSIINVSSMIGRGAYANFLAYATSKWGLEGFSQTLAAEVRSSNIRVNSVEPGYVATKLTGFTNKTYYRVVAVDAEGKRSGPSDYAVAPRPVIYSKPALEAKVGVEYRGQISANRSLGDLRKRNPEVAKFWDIEYPKYALKGPSWLKLDADTGALSGTPDAAGKFEVEVTATIDREVRKLDEGALGWGQEKVLSTSTERVGSATQRFVIEVSP